MRIWENSCHLLQSVPFICYKPFDWRSDHYDIQDYFPYLIVPLISCWFTANFHFLLQFGFLSLYTSFFLSLQLKNLKKQDLTWWCYAAITPCYKLSLYGDVSRIIFFLSLFFDVLVFIWLFWKIHCRKTEARPWFLSRSSQIPSGWSRKLYLHWWQVNAASWLFSYLSCCITMLALKSRLLEKVFRPYISTYNCWDKILLQGKKCGGSS